MQTADDDALQPRIVKAVHANTQVERDPDFELGLSAHLRAANSREQLIELYARFSAESEFDMRMRRSILRALAKAFGHGVRVGIGVGFKHPETFEIGDGSFIGAQTYIQGRFDGVCRIGKRVWIGPQSYFDARALIIEDCVGWGPGAKVLGSAHTGIPADVPITETDLEIKPVHVKEWADIGTNAVLLPGVTVGKGSIVGAGAVVVKDVPDFAIVAGVPARFLRWREGADHPQAPETPRG